jgi:hypothetical protein
VERTSLSSALVRCSQLVRASHVRTWTLTAGMYLVGCADNFCCYPSSLARADSTDESPPLASAHPGHGSPVNQSTVGL